MLPSSGSAKSGSWAVSQASATTPLGQAGALPALGGDIQGKGAGGTTGEPTWRLFSLAFHTSGTTLHPAHQPLWEVYGKVKGWAVSEDTSFSLGVGSQCQGSLVHCARAFVFAAGDASAQA